MYIYGTFDANTSKTLLISKPLQVELKFELPSEDLNKQIPILANINTTPSKPVSEDTVYSKAEDEIKTSQNNELIESTMLTFYRRRARLKKTVSSKKFQCMLKKLFLQ